MGLSIPVIQRQEPTAISRGRLSTLSGRLRMTLPGCSMPLSPAPGNRYALSLDSETGVDFARSTSSPNITGETNEKIYCTGAAHSDNCHGEKPVRRHLEGARRFDSGDRQARGFRDQQRHV